jgi:hypothetical protein
VELVERMQSKLQSVLENVLNQAHPDKAGLFLELLRKIPDLRTLNTLHSVKLLAFKMTEQQQQQQKQQQQQQQSSPNHHRPKAKLHFPPAGSFRQLPHGPEHQRHPIQQHLLPGL